MQLARALLYENGGVVVNKGKANSNKGVDRDLLDSSQACVLAAFGFACTTVWGTYMVFSPALPILSFGPTSLGVACLLVSKLLAIMLLTALTKKPSLILRKLNEIVIPGVLVFYGPAFVLAAWIWMSGLTVPPVFQIAIWALLGFGELSFSFAWPILFASMPARWSSLSIATGGALATPMFLLIADAKDPLVGLIGMFLLVVADAATIAYLLRNTSPDLLPKIKKRAEGPTVNLRAAASIAASGAAYGFMTIMLCLMGAKAVIIAALAGLSASALAIVWAMRRIEKRWDVGMVQRMTMPVIIGTLLLIPLVGDMGRTVAGAIATAAFAYSTLMEWTDAAVTNFEFQIHPVKRTAEARLSQWSGFLAGGVLSYAVFETGALQGVLPFIVAALVVFLVSAFAFYGADDSATKDALAMLVADDPKNLTIEPPKNAAPFRDRCAILAERYGLSEREAEVFVLLAKGRNSEHIQKKLFISGNTVKTHVSHIYRKIGISSQQSLIDLVDQRFEEPPTSEKILSSDTEMLRSITQAESTRL